MRSLHWDAGPDLAADADIAIAAVGSSHLVTLDADAALSGLAEGPAAALLAGRSTLGGRMLVRDDGRIALDRIQAKMAGGTLTAIGEVDLLRRSLDVNVGAAPADPAAFSELLPDLTWGGADADVRIFGAFESPRVEATAEIRGFETPDVAMSAITVEAILDRVAEVGDGGRLRLWGEGSLTGVSLGVAELDTLLSGEVTWQLTAAAGLDGPVSVEQARIEIADTVLTASGDLARDGGGAATGTLTVADLGAFQALAALPIEGRTDLSWQALSENGGITVSAEGAVLEPQSGIAEIDALLTDRAELEATVTRHPDGRIAVDGIRIASGANRLSGQAAYSDGRLAADWALTVPSVAPFSDMLGAAADGRLSGAGRLEGSIERLSLGADLSLEAAVYDGFALPDLNGRLDLGDITGQPAGDIRLDGEFAGLPASLMTGLAVTDAEVRFDAISADFAGWTVTGALGVTPDGLARGKLAARTDDMAALAAIGELPLSGQADVIADFSVQDGRQDLRAAIDLVGPAYDMASTASASGTVDVADLFGERRLRVGIGASDLSAAGAAFDQVDIEAQGTIDALGVSVTAAGPEITGQASGSVSSIDEPTRVVVETLRAEFRGAPFLLTQPASVTIASDMLSVDRLAVQAGQGRAVLAGSLGEGLDATVEGAGPSVGAAGAGRARPAG